MVGFRVRRLGFRAKASISDARLVSSYNSRFVYLDGNACVLDLCASPTLTTGLNKQTPVSALQCYLSALPTPTAVRSAVHAITRVLLLHTANHVRASHLVLGTSLTSLSVNLINLVAQGGGFNIRDENYEEWTPLRGSCSNGVQSMSMPVKIVRPLKDIGSKECAAWAWWNNLRPIYIQTAPGLSEKSTIQNLTNGQCQHRLYNLKIRQVTDDDNVTAFIIGLEKDYPSTVSTIARTCEKLIPRGDSVERCLLCERCA